MTLWGRDATRLAAVADACRALGADVETENVDLCDPAAALSALQATDDASPVDLLVLNAGISDIRPEGERTEASQIVLKTALVNYASPVTMATEAARRMAGRGVGDIVMIGSVAAYHDLPFATAYASSKAGLARFATSLCAAMQPYNVGVTLAVPGFIDTPMSRRLDGARPFLVSPHDAARIIADATRKRKGVVVFPRIFRFLAVVEALVPRRIAHMLLRHIRVRQNPC